MRLDFRLARRRVAAPASAIAFVLVVVALSGCMGSPIATGTNATGTGSTTTEAASTTTTTTVPASTVPTIATTVAPSTTAPVTSEVGAHWLSVSMAIPSGWSVRPTSQESSKSGCIAATQPSPGTPSWAGCAGIWVVPWSSDPAKPAAGYVDPGQVWFMNNGVAACPFRSTHPDDVVLSPGTLIGKATRTVGRVAYRWYEWSATCNLNGSPGAPVTHSFDTQVWWLPTAGIAFLDVAGHPQIGGILASVRTTHPPSTTTTAPASSVEFRSPTGNIHCGIHYSPSSPTSSSNVTHCFTDDPPQGVTLTTKGTYTTCSGASCVAAPSAAENELAYGQSAGLGPFTCASATSGVTCTVDGKGFQISRSGVAAA